MLPRPAVERITVLVLILTSVLAACERKADAEVHADKLQPRNGPSAVVPVLGIRG
jgi:hypothetical protein